MTAKPQPTPPARMPSTIYPHEQDEHGNTTHCQLCGEPADDEMGEFSLPVNPFDHDYLTKDYPTVVAHGQCGLDHGLEMA